MDGQDQLRPCAACPACPDRAGLLYAWQRGIPAELPRGVERAGGDADEEWPTAGALRLGCPLGL